MTIKKLSKGIGVKKNQPVITKLFTNNLCAKSIQVRSYFWSIFSRIQSEYGKIRARKITCLDTFNAVYDLLNNASLSVKIRSTQHNAVLIMVR